MSTYLCVYVCLVVRGWGSDC